MRSFVYSLLIFLAVSCTDQDIQFAFPVIETLEVSEADDLGVTLNAKVHSATSDTDILQFGFLWSQGDPDKNSQVLKIDQGFKTGEFSYRLESGLQIGTNYTIRAFIQTTDRWIYGDPITFTGNSLLPVIESFEPTSGFGNQTITVYGSNLLSAHKPFVTIEGVINGEVLEQYYDSLTFWVGNTGFQSGSGKILLTYDMEVVSSATEFSLLGITITSIDKSSYTVAEEMIVSGTFYDNFEPSLVRFMQNGNIRASLTDVTHVNETTLSLNVPQLNPGTYQVYFFSGSFLFPYRPNITIVN